MVRPDSASFVKAHNSIGADASVGLAWAASLITIVSHWLYGAQRNEVAVLQGAAFALILVIALARDSTRRDVVGAPYLPWLGLLFGMVLITAFASLSSNPLSGPNPAWRGTSTPGSISIDPSATFLEIVKLSSLACAFLIGCLAGADDDRAKTTLTTIILGGAAFAVWSIYAFASGDPSARFGPRLAAHFMSANGAATLMAMLAVLSAMMTVHQSRRGRDAPRIQWFAAGGATVVFAVALFATMSRAGIAAAAVGISLALILEFSTRRDRSSPHLFWFGGGAVLAMGLALSGGQLAERYFNVATDLQSRQLLLNLHWDAFRAFPISGQGLGTFPTINRSQLNAENFSAIWNVNSAHNVYVQWLEEGGLVSATPMFLVIAVIMALTLRGILRRKRMVSVLCGLLAVDIVILAHGWTDYAVQIPSIAGLWAFLLGIQFTLSQGSTWERASKPGVLRTAAAALLGAGVLLGALLTTIALQHGPVELGRWRPVELAAGYDRAALRILQNPSSARLEVSERLTTRALDLAPYSVGARLRLVYIDAARQGSLSPKGAADFAKSYETAPLDPEYGRWRVRFGLEHWSELHPRTREALRHEADVLLADESIGRYVRADLRAIKNPSGRMVARFWLNRVERTLR